MSIGLVTKPCEGSNHTQCSQTATVCVSVCLEESEGRAKVVGCFDRKELMETLFPSTGRLCGLKNRYISKYPYRQRILT